MLRKVTAFILRWGKKGHEVLLLRHPFAGVQFPAGTVEPGEPVAEAVLREIKEETGMEDLHLHAELGSKDEPVRSGYRFICAPTLVYSRPDPDSFDWAHFRPGATVRLERSQEEYAQVTYIEYDRLPEPTYATYQITGWVPQAVLVDKQTRYFFWFDCLHSTPDSWSLRADNHQFTLFWAPLDDLPEIISPQNGWISFLLEAFNGSQSAQSEGSP